VRIPQHPGRRYTAPNRKGASCESSSQRISSRGLASIGVAFVIGATPRPRFVRSTPASAGLYGVGPFGLEPQVLCMTITSSGSAGTRGETGTPRMERFHESARRHGECFRIGL